MMDLSWVAIGAVAVLGVLVVAMLLQLQRLRQQQAQQLAQQQEERQRLESRIKHLESKLEFVSTSTKGMGQRLMTAEKKINLSLEKQDELLSNNSEKLLQRQAERLLKKVPKSEEEPTLSRSEAKLMALVGGNTTDKS